MSCVVKRFDGRAWEWDDFVRAQRGWTHFHLHAWGQVIASVHGHEPVYLAAWRDAEDRMGEPPRLAAVLPMVRVRSLLFGHYLVSMPYVNYGGPLGEPDAVRALVSEAAEMARHEQVRLLELRSRAALDIDVPPSHRKITVLLDLPDDSASLWKQLAAKVRSQIRRPQKDGVDVRFGADQVVPFYRVFARHMRDLGTPVQPLGFFEALAARFGDDFWVACAYHGGQPIACGAGFRWADEFEITWASALREHKQLAANMLVYWALMERAIETGARVFNFGRCTPGGGTHRFKQQWGGRDVPLWWYGSSGAAGAAARAPSPDDRRYALATRVWQRLPHRITTALGPAIVRGIP